MTGAHSWLWRGEGWAGRDSSCGAQLGLTGRGFVVAAIVLAAARVGPHVVLWTHGDGEECWVTLTGFRAPFVAGHVHRALCITRVDRGLRSPGLVPGYFHHLTASPVHCCLERPLLSPQSHIPLTAWGKAWRVEHCTQPFLSLPLAMLVSPE